MAASEQTSARWIDAHERLKAVTETLRDCARNEQWDRMTALAAEQSRLASAIGSKVPEAVLAGVDGHALAVTIAQIADANAEALARLEAWQRSIGESIQQLENVHTNVSRLSKAYR